MTEKTKLIQRFTQPTPVSARDLWDINELAEIILALNAAPERGVTRAKAEKIVEIISFYELREWIEEGPSIFDKHQTGIADFYPEPRESE